MLNFKKKISTNAKRLNVVCKFQGFQKADFLVINNNQTYPSSKWCLAIQSFKPKKCLRSLIIFEIKSRP